VYAYDALIDVIIFDVVDIIFVIFQLFINTYVIASVWLFGWLVLFISIILQSVGFYLFLGLFECPFDIFS